MKKEAALVIVGVLLGAVMMNIYLCQRMDALYLSRERLKVKLYENEERLKKMEAQWQNHRALLIRDVEIQFAAPVKDSYLEIKLREAVTKLTQNLVGEDLEKVPHSLVVHLLDQRVIEIEGKRYRIQVQTVVMAETLTYVLRYAQQAEQNPDEP